MEIATITTTILGILAGILFVALFKRIKPVWKGRKTKKKWEFKKIIVTAVLLTYFLGIVVGTAVTIMYDVTQLGALLAFIGTPTTGAILSYCYVIRTENAIKLKQQYPKETEGYSVDINNTSV